MIGLETAPAGWGWAGVKMLFGLGTVGPRGLPPPKVGFGTVWAGWPRVGCVGSAGLASELVAPPGLGGVGCCVTVRPVGVRPVGVPPVGV